MMRLVTWNCRGGGFRWKASRVARLLPQPDVLAVQEVEPVNQGMFAEESRPGYVDRSSAPGFPRRGFGMFSYSQTEIYAVDGSAAFSGFRRYEVRRNGVSFNVAGVWPWATRSAKTSYRQAHVGLAVHAEWIRMRPTVLLGDFNASARYQGRNWQELLDLITGFGLVSAYHRFKQVPFGSEREEPTHFHRGEQAASFHLDYCFIPETWVASLADVSVGTHDAWHEVSDHVPLIVDLSL